MHAHRHLCQCEVVVEVVVVVVVVVVSLQLSEQLFFLTHRHCKRESVAASADTAGVLEVSIGPVHIRNPKEKRKKRTMACSRVKDCVGGATAARKS